MLMKTFDTSEANDDLQAVNLHMDFDNTWGGMQKLVIMLTSYSPLKWFVSICPILNGTEVAQYL